MGPCGGKLAVPIGGFCFSFVMALDLRSTGCGFEHWPVCCPVVEDVSSCNVKAIRGGLGKCVRHGHKGLCACQSVSYIQCTCKF